MQVTSRELSEKLEKVMRGEHKFNWHRMPDGTFNYFMPREEKMLHIDCKLLYPAYTLDELLKELPKIIEINGSGYLLDIDLPSKTVYYERAGYGSRLHEESYNHINELTEAAGKLLLWTIENGYKEAPCKKN